MKLPRLTLRGLMVAIAIVALILALGLWVARVVERREVYRKYAAYHAVELKDEQLTIKIFDLDRQIRHTEPKYGKPTEEHLREESAAHARAARHAGLELRYQRGVRRPWEVLPLDPPNLEEAAMTIKSIDDLPELLPPEPPEPIVAPPGPP